MKTNFKVIGLTRLGIKLKSRAPEAYALYQSYHWSTPKNKHAEVRLPKSQKLFNVKALKIGEDQTKRSSRPQSPDYPLKIGEDQKKKIFTYTDRGALLKFEIGGPCRAVARAVDLKWPSVYQEGPKFQIKHNIRCFQKSKLVNCGSHACQLERPGPPWPRPWGLHNAKNIIILRQMFENFFSYVPFGVSYFCPRPTTSAEWRRLLPPPPKGLDGVLWFLQ